MAKKKTTTQKVKDASKKAGKKASNAFAKASKKAIDNPVDTAKIIGIIALIGVAYVVVRKFSKNLTENFELTSDENPLETQVDINPANLTLTQQEANNIAHNLLQAMTDAGTDEEAIGVAFSRMKSGDDFKLVFEAFGTQKYSGFGLPSSGVPEILVGGKKQDLIFWLKSELSTSDPEYAIVKSRVESAGLIF